MAMIQFTEVMEILEGLFNYIYLCIFSGIYISNLIISN